MIESSVKPHCTYGVGKIVMPGQQAAETFMLRFLSGVGCTVKNETAMVGSLHSGKPYIQPHWSQYGPRSRGAKPYGFKWPCALTKVFYHGVHQGSGTRALNELDIGFVRNLS